jgi:hypothetical protein
MIADYTGLRANEKYVHEYEFGINGDPPKKIRSSIIRDHHASCEQPSVPTEPYARSPYHRFFRRLYSAVV